MIQCPRFNLVLKGNQTSRADPGIFDWGGPNFGSDRTVELFFFGGGINS